MIRRKLKKGEDLDNPEEFRALFLGRNFGVGLSTRDMHAGDNHVAFTILVEDDGFWTRATETTGGKWSSCWMPDVRDVFQAAISWLRKNADRDGSKGWKFR